MPGCLGKWWLGYSKGVAGIKLRISILMGWFYFILFFFFTDQRRLSLFE